MGHKINNKLTLRSHTASLFIKTKLLNKHDKGPKLYVGLYLGTRHFHVHVYRSYYNMYND